MPAQSDEIRFETYTLHPVQGLTRGNVYIRVTPKALAVLYTLARRSGRIVTKEELFAAVWPDALVTDAALSSCIRELRLALGDKVRNPRFIETAHRRGYRFLPACNRSSENAADDSKIDASPNAVPFFGRDAELAHLASLMQAAREHRPQVVSIVGEHGIGKSALVDAFIGSPAIASQWYVCRGYCDDRHRAGIAYHPLMQALHSLCMQSDGARLATELRRVAPTWLAEVPGVCDIGERNLLWQRTSGVTTKRLHHELNSALRAIAELRPVLLVLEDLQWSDRATLEWLDALDDFDWGRILVLITCVEQPKAGSSGGDFAHNGAWQQVDRSTLSLGPLDSAVTAQFLRQICRTTDICEMQGLADAVFDASGGNPSLICFLIREWMNNVATSRKIPGAQPEAGTANHSNPVARLINRRIARLQDTELRVLRAACLVGARFSEADLAAGADLPRDDAVDVLGRLCSTGDIVPECDAPGTYPEAGERRYRLCAPALADAIRRDIPPAERREIHRRIAQFIADRSGPNAPGRSPEIAFHFEQAYVVDKAVSAYHDAASLCRRRGAHAIASSHLERALALLPSMPRSVTRDLWHARLLVARGSEQIASEGFSSAATDQCFGQALGMLSGLPVNTSSFSVTWALWTYYLNRGPLGRTVDLADRLVAHSEELGSAELRLDAHHAKWCTSLLQGDLQAVLRHTRRGMAICGEGIRDRLAMTRGCTLHDAHTNNHHAAVCAGFFGAWADALSGRAEQAKLALDAAITHARDVGHPYSLGVALVMSAAVLATSGDAVNTRRYASEGSSIAAENGFEALGAWAGIYDGWASARLGDAGPGLRRMRRGLAAFQDTTLTLLRPFQLSLAADVEIDYGLLERAAGTLGEAFEISDRVGERFALPELLRLRAKFRLAVSESTASIGLARQDLEAALEVANAQQAALLGSRIRAGLSHLRSLTVRNPTRLPTEGGRPDSTTR